jgi:hypothetical protein
MPDLSSWSKGMRVIVRKERPYPGAQLRFTDIGGHRFTCLATSTKGGQLADLELRHRRRACCGCGSSPAPGGRPEADAGYGSASPPSGLGSRHHRRLRPHPGPGTRLTSMLIHDTNGLSCRRSCGGALMRLLGSGAMVTAG